MKHNIVFLDFDGVLVNEVSWRLRSRNHHPAADPDAVACLNQLTARAPASIVVSSSWRFGRTEAQLLEILKAWGVTGRFAGATPNLAISSRHRLTRCRGQEISQWLVEHRRTWRKFVILDDGTDVKPFYSRLVRTNFRRGLEPEHVELALAMLR